MSEVRCSFYVRTPVDGGFRYDAVSVPGPAGDSYLHTDHPPLVGDLIQLPAAKAGAPLRVVARKWMHASFGSANWPYGERRPVKAPTLQIIIEVAEGLFIDEVANDEEDEP